MGDVSRRAVLVVGGSAVSALGIALSRTRWSGRPLAGRPTPTSFGSVTVLASSRVGTSTAAGHRGTSAGAAHAAPGRADAVVASAVHGAWTAGVVVDLEARNRLQRPVALSPGQFRVRVGGRGPTVSLYSSDLDAGSLEAGATRTFRITYLAPPPDRRLSLEFDDPGSQRPVSLGDVGHLAERGA